MPYSNYEFYILWCFWFSRCNAKVCTTKNNDKLIVVRLQHNHVPKVARRTKGERNQIKALRKAKLGLDKGTTNDWLLLTINRNRIEFTSRISHPNEICPWLFLWNKQMNQMFKFSIEFFGGRSIWGCDSSFQSSLIQLKFLIPGSSIEFIHNYAIKFTLQIRCIPKKHLKFLHNSCP